LRIYFITKIFPLFWIVASTIGALTHEYNDTTPNELREQIDGLSWQEPLVHSHPHIKPITAPNQFRSLMEVWHKSSDLNQPHFKDFARSPDPLRTGAGKHSVVNQRRVVKSNGIPWAYTFGRARDGSAWIFLYQQKLSEGQYYRDRLYYNKLGEILCRRMGVIYLGSDSGVFQRKETFELLLNTYALPIKTKLTKTFEFDRRYHHAGRKELIRSKGGFKYRNGIDVGNGQGLQYIGNGENLQNVAQLLSRKTKLLSAGSPSASISAGVPSAQPGVNSNPHTAASAHRKADHQSGQKKSIQAIKQTSQHDASGLPSVLDIPGVDKKYTLPPDYIIHVV
jgi:hypothetical protein